MTRTRRRGSRGVSRTKAGISSGHRGAGTSWSSRWPCAQRRTRSSQRRAWGGGASPRIVEHGSASGLPSSDETIGSWDAEPLVRIFDYDDMSTMHSSEGKQNFTNCLNLKIDQFEVVKVDTCRFIASFQGHRSARTHRSHAPHRRRAGGRLSSASGGD